MSYKTPIDLRLSSWLWGLNEKPWSRLIKWSLLFGGLVFLIKLFVHNNWDTITISWLYFQAIIRTYLLSWILPNTWWASFRVPIEGNNSHLPFTYILSAPFANMIVLDQWHDLQQSLRVALSSLLALTCMRFYGLFFTEKQWVVGGIKILSKEETLQHSSFSSGNLLLEEIPIDSKKGPIWLWGNNRPWHLCWQTLYHQIQERSLVFCSYVYANLDHDDLLHPGDERSVRWNMWEEPNRELIIQHFLPNNAPYDPFWIEAAQNVLRVSIDALQQQPSYQKLVYTTLHASLNETEEFYANTPVAMWMNASSREAVFFIRDILRPCMEIFNGLPDPTNGWSVQKWIQTNRSLMIASDHPFWKPLTSLLWKIALQSIQKTQTKMWIIVENHHDLGINLRDIQAIYPSTLGTIVGASKASPSMNVVLQHGTHIIWGGVDVHTAEHLSRACGYQEMVVLGRGQCHMADGVTLHGEQKSVTALSAQQIYHLGPDEMVLCRPDEKFLAKIDVSDILTEKEKQKLLHLQLKSA